MKKFLKGFGGFILFGMAVIGPLYMMGIVKQANPNNNPAAKALPLVISVIAAILWIKFYFLKNRASKKLQKSANKEEITTTLTNNGIETISKKVEITQGQCLYVDNDNKKWGIMNIGRNKKVEKCLVFSYESLIKYTVDKEKILNTQGRSGSAVVGGVTFGVLGAVAGSSRKKKTTEKVKNVTVNLVINSLNTPNISIVCDDVNTANTLVGVIEFIIANK